RGSAKMGIWSALWISTIKAATLLPSASKKYVASALTLFIYFSSFLKRFGSCTILFPSSVGIFARIKNLIFQKVKWSLYLLILVFTSPSTSFLSFGPEQYASGQKISQIQIAKVFLDDAIKALKNNDIIGASYRLNLSKQQIENAPTNTSIQAAKVFIQDALQALDTFNVSKAIERINLAKQG